MPKIIENPEQRLLEEARRQIETNGYASMTVRSVAGACSIGIGTVYNYFPSKEAMVAAYILKDWEMCLAAIRSVSEAAGDAEPLLRCIYDELKRFSDLHRAVFQDETAASGFGGVFRKYHVLLRAQLAEPLRKFCSSDFSAEFIAEALITWSLSGKDYDELSAVFTKLFS